LLHLLLRRLALVPLCPRLAAQLALLHRDRSLRITLVRLNCSVLMTTRVLLLCGSCPKSTFL
jgi:hypothetical protein